ncbi:uncharacterized protein LOC127846408 [Dreissena polymorpha]|uniref:BTB domain-containing protein n=1 Tax=Dreissena polymorpha TaxID=45954 RepID=A0A9D4E994_DREPO|nr:uncharacterized protein LOC127846408 [Dreissena polymorpha]KAH3775531.1 hypothetical protein DPMN_176934 [Dreissena polymorpha]
METANTFRPNSTKAALWKQVDEQSDVCDFTIKVGDWAKRFHSSIMMASPFFQCVIDSEFMLCKPACIELTATGASSAEMTILFLYGKCPTLTEANINEMFSLAEFLLIPNLKALCVKFAQCITISKENVIAQLKLASLYEFDHPRALEYVHSHLDDLLEDDSLIPASKDFIQSLFANETLRYISMDTRLHFLIRWTKYDAMERKRIFQDFVALLDIIQLSEQALRSAATELGEQCCANLLQINEGLERFKPREIIATISRYSSYPSKWYDINNDQWMNPSVPIDTQNTNRHNFTFACALNPFSYGVCFPSKIEIVDVLTNSYNIVNLSNESTDIFEHVCANSSTVLATSFQKVKVLKSEEQIKVDENIRAYQAQAMMLQGVPLHYILMSLNEVSPTATVRKMMLHIGNIEASSTDVAMRPLFTLNSSENVKVYINTAHTCAIVNKKNIILFDTLTYQMDTFEKINITNSYQVVPHGDGFVLHDDTHAVCIHKVFGPCLKERYIFRSFTLPQDRDKDGHVRPGRFQYRLIGDLWIRGKQYEENVFEKSLERFTLHWVADPNTFTWKQCSKTYVIGDLFSSLTTAMLLRVPMEKLRCHIDCPHCKALQKTRQTYDTNDFAYERRQCLWKADENDSDDASFGKYEPKRTYYAEYDDEYYDDGYNYYDSDYYYYDSSD